MRFLIALALLVAVSAQVSHVRLAYVPGGMNVGWTTPDQPTDSTVSFGVAPDALLFKASGSAKTYGDAYFNYVDLNNLNPDTLYYYQINGESTVRTFRTAPVLGSTKPLSIGVIGDMGVRNSADTMKQLNVILNETDFYFHVGDISYADDWYLRLGDTYQGTWDSYMTQMEPVTSSKAYMVMPGNHEAACQEAWSTLCPSSEKNFTTYRYRFNMPNQQSGGTDNMWYSFDVGMVHFVAISTETDFPNAPEGPSTRLSSGPFGDQLSWLEKDLAAAALNRANVPWIVVGGHRPMYSSGGSCDACRAVFEPLFTKFNVDLYISGHVHWYERLWPVAPGGTVTQQNYDNPAGPVYVVNGAAGNVEDHTTESTRQPYSDYINDTDYGFARMNIYNSTTLEWKFFRSSDAGLLDSFVLTKNH